MSAINAVVLAAGKGTRMRSDRAKVLHRAAGRTLLDWVLEAVDQAKPQRTVVVVGHQAAAVTESLGEGADTVLQDPQNGTGHAVQVAMSRLSDIDAADTVLVAYGDMPLVSAEVYQQLGDRPSEVAAVITTVDPGPDAFGRIKRDPEGRVVGIVEKRDCDPQELAITERNAGIYSFAAGPLREALASLATDNAQGELYLTDVIAHLASTGRTIEVRPVDRSEVIGVNSHADLSEVQQAFVGRINRRLMEAGVWMLDPSRVYVDATVTVEPGARLYPGTHLEGATTVAGGAVVGPDTMVVDSVIGEDATVQYSVLRQAAVGAGVSVGPYASLRPGTVLEAGAKAGTFVEMKNTRVGEGGKVPHLSYMGDAIIGANANVGAGSITCNYDGYEKHQTVVGEGAFVGSDTMLVAPVTIGDGAVTAAGSVITSDVPEGALGIERSSQQDIPGYAEKRAARQQAKDADRGS